MIDSKKSTYKTSQKLQSILEVNDKAMVIKGFNDAIMGLGEVFNKIIVVYNYDICIDILMNDMSEDEAIEYFEHNIANCYMGEYTPIFITQI